MGKFIDLTGQKFGRLTVVKRGPDYRPSEKRMMVTWWCRCDCNNPELILVTAASLRNGDTKSCGCLKLERAAEMGSARKKQNRYEFHDNYVVGWTNKGEPFFFDAEDYDLVSQYCWYSWTEGYIAARIGDKHIKLHRLVMHAKPGDIVDHIIHNKADCRKVNLRIVSRAANGWYRGLLSNNTSGYTGVVYHKREKKWRAQIRCNGVLHRLGSFANKEDAIAARRAAEEKYFGEYPYTNSMAAVPQITLPKTSPAAPTI